jgi:hypothetical protein
MAQNIARHVWKSWRFARNEVPEKSTLPCREIISGYLPELSLSGKDKCKSGKLPVMVIVRLSKKLLVFQRLGTG